MSTTEHVVGDVASKFLERLLNGESPDVNEWLLRYPAHASQLRSVLQTLQTLHKRLDQFPRSPDHELEGTQIGDYRLEKKVGHGGMGRVFAATCLKDHQRVAVKLIAGGSGKLQKERRLQQEFRILSQLQHPAFAGVYDLVRTPGEWCLVMEFVEGDNLASIVREHGPLQVDKAVRVIRDIALALQYAHRQGVIHRDLKPANLMLDNQGLIRIVDFGLATFRAELVAWTDTLQQMHSMIHDFEPLTTASAELLGTLAYMAPEQALHPSDVDGRADIYGLGCTLYFLLTGESPFGRRSTLATLIAQREERPRSMTERNPDVPRWLERLCFSMLAPEMNHRPQSMSEIVRRIDRCSSTAKLQRCTGAIWSMLTAVRPVTEKSTHRLPDTSGSFQDRRFSVRALFRRILRRDAILALLVLLPATVFTWIVLLSGAKSEPSRRASLSSSTIPESQLSGIGTSTYGIAAATQQTRLRVPSPSGRPVSLVSARGQTYSVLETIGDAGLRHWNYISDVMYSHDGRHLVSGSWDGTVAIWDAQTRTQRNLFESDQWITDIDLSGDDRFVGIAVRNTGAIVWDWQAGQVIDRFLWASDSEDSSIAFHPQQPLLAICDDRQADIVIRNFQTGQTVRRWSGDADSDLSGVCFTPDGNRLLSLGAQTGVRLWNWQQGTLLQNWEVGEAPLRTFCVHPEAPEFAVGDADGFVRVYRFADRQPLNSARAHDAPCRRVVYSADGNLLFTSGEDQRIQAFDAELSSVVRIIAERTRSNWGLAAHPDGQWLASCGTDQEILQWRIQQTNQRRDPDRFRARVMSLDFGLETDALLLGCADGTVRLRPEATSEWRSFADHQREVVAVVFRPHHPDQAASASRDGTVRLWHLTSGSSSVVHEHPGSAFCAAWSADGDWIASGGWDRSVQASNLRTNESLTLTGHLNMVNSVAFCGTPPRLVSADGDRMSPWQSASLRVWDLASQQQQHGLTADSALMAIRSIPGLDSCLFGGYEASPLSLVSSGMHSRNGALHPVAVDTTQNRICWSLAVHPRQPLVAMGDGQGQLTFWEFPDRFAGGSPGRTEPAVVTGSDEHDHHLRETIVIGPPTGELPALCFNQSGTKLGVVQGDGQLLIVDFPFPGTE